jgi:hypothetical protein
MPLNFDPMINAYQIVIDSLYKIAVPENLTFAHKEQIALLTAQKNALVIAENYKENPMESLLALSAGERLFEEFINLQKALKQTIE